VAWMDGFGHSGDRGFAHVDFGACEWGSQILILRSSQIR